jgi:hypothetical protein
VVNRPRLGTLTRVKNSFIFPIQQCDVGSYWEELVSRNLFWLRPCKSVKRLQMVLRPF